MDVGLTPQQRLILRRARSVRLRGSERHQIRPPLWSLALLALLLMPFSHGLSLLVIPALGYWLRRSTAERISAWALDLRED